MLRVFVMCVLGMLALTVGVALLMLGEPVAAGPTASPVPTPVPPGPGPSPIDPGVIPTIPEFLEFIAGPEGWAAVGVAISMMLARWAWYNRQSDDVKRALPIVGAIIVGIIGQVLLTYVPAAVWDALFQYWFVVYGSLLTWLGSQAWFRFVVKPRRGEG
jgi:hypothetical protein